MFYASASGVASPTMHGEARPSGSDLRLLVEQAQRGDHGAFALLVGRLSERLYGIAVRITGDPGSADDAVQDGLIDAWRQLPRLREPGLFDNWITRIVVRKSVRDTVRARRAPRPLGSATDWAQADSAARIAERDAMDQAFATLKPDHRAVLVLRYYMGFEPTQIAEALSLPAGTVRSRIHYALSSLRGQLEAEARTGVGTP